MTPQKPPLLWVRSSPKHPPAWRSSRQPLDNPDAGREATRRADQPEWAEAQELVELAPRGPLALEGQRDSDADVGRRCELPGVAGWGGSTRLRGLGTGW